MVVRENICRARALYLLDTENLAGMPLPTDAALARLRHAVEQAASR